MSCALIAVILTLSGFIGGSARAGNGSRGAQNRTGTLGGIRFEVPESFALYTGAGTDSSTVLLRQIEDGDFLFVTIPPVGASPDAALERVKTFALRVLKVSEPKAYSWKAVGDDDGVSKHELHHERLQGFDGKARVILQYRHIRYASKDFAVGYFFALGTEYELPEEAAELFRDNLGADSAPACLGLSDLLASITHETIPDTCQPPPAAPTPVTSALDRGLTSACSGARAARVRP